MGSWRPLLPPVLADRALEAVEEIARDIQARQERSLISGGSSSERASLASGSAGRILFFAYLDRVLPEEGWGDRAAETIEQAIDDLAETPAALSLYTGFTGLAWVLEHLRGWFLDEDDDLGEEIAAAVE